MDIVLAAVGRAKAGPERDLFDEYARRLRWPLIVREVEDRRPRSVAARSVAERVAREGELLLAALPAGAVVVALDAAGKPLTSEDFAHRLGTWRDQGAASVAFLIGGADGHGAAVRARADLTLSLGPMVWPHLLVRTMLAEQIYRGQCILDGHPYHRGRQQD
ncbi:MAG: 23S rRNA (pseudouridine(1915)-N(3))-methyltransferase RlmH [Alphaproteobacteria bacterium]